jgi:Skp family chaperone for outer membrane proteins
MKLFRNTILAFALVLGFTSAPAFATNVAVISQEITLAKSKVGAYVADQLIAIEKQIDADFEPELAPLRTKAQQLTAEFSALSPEVLRTRNDLLRRRQDLQTNLSELANWKQRQMAASRNQALGPVLQAYETAVNAVIAEKNIDVLLDGTNILFRNKESDITEAVIVKMDAAITTAAVTRVRVPRKPPAPQQGQPASAGRR